MSSDLRLQVINGPDVTDEQLASCAALFSSHYGIWGVHAPRPVKPAARVTMPVQRLRRECFKSPENTALVIAYRDNVHVGHAFMTKWTCGEEAVAWVTQLVVHSEHRRQHIATSMLREIKDTLWFHGVSIVGIASTHPAALNTLTNLALVDIAQIDLAFIREHAADVMKCSPVDYLKSAKLHGELFEETCTDNAVSLADTHFFVDHGEPLATLDTYVSVNRWKLGKLREGHEFLLVLSLSPQERTNPSPIDGDAL